MTNSLNELDYQLNNGPYHNYYHSGKTPMIYFHVWIKFKSGNTLKFAKSIQMKKKLKKKSFYKGPVLSLTHKISDINFNCIGITFSSLAERLEMDEPTILNIVKTKIKDKIYEAQDIITEQIWIELKEFILNKVSLNARKDKIIEAKIVKVIKLGKKKRKLLRKRKSKSSPILIKGNLHKIIYNGMTN